MFKAKILTIFSTIFVVFSLIGADFRAFAAENAENPPTEAAVTDEKTEMPQYNFENVPEIHSQAAIMVNTDQNVIVMAKNADEKMYPASLTKIMTCLVAFENIKDFNATVSVPYAVTDEFWYKKGNPLYNPNYYGASDAGIEPLQENLTITDALYATMLASGCEAANIVAYHVGGGSIDNFVGMMNETAKKIGCSNTHFTNAHGLFDENNYTTARDMYLITRYALDNYPGFKKLCETTSYDMPANKRNPSGYTIRHTSQLIRKSTTAEENKYYYEGAAGVKTGSIYEFFVKRNVEGKEQWVELETLGIRTLVSTAQRNGYNYICVTLGAPYYADETKKERVFYEYTDQIALYNWAFENFEYRPRVKINEKFGSIPVDLGDGVSEVGFISTEDYYALLPKFDVTGESVIYVQCSVEEQLTAPFDAGVKVGELQLYMDKKLIKTIPVVTESFVALDKMEKFRRDFDDFIHSPAFIVPVVVVSVLIVGLIVLRIVLKKKKQKNARYRRQINVARGGTGGTVRPSRPQQSRPGATGRNNKNIRRK